MSLNRKHTQELIDEVKKLYPNSKEMINLAETGGYSLGRWLDDSSTNTIPVDKILSATSLEKLQDEARVIKQKRDLFYKWREQTI